MFLRGSYVYCKLPIIALAFFTLLIASAEFFFQKTDIGFMPVLGANFLFYASVWILLFIIEFIAECMGGGSGWRLVCAYHSSCRIYDYLVDSKKYS